MMYASNQRIMGRTSKTPVESRDRVLQGLLDRYMTTVDDAVTKESLAVSVRGYYLFKVTERRCAAAVSFNSMVDDYYNSDESEFLKEVNEPLSPPRYGRDVYRKKLSRRENSKQAPVDGNGEKPKSGVITTSSRARVDAVDDNRQIAQICERGRQLLRVNENQKCSTPFNRGASVRARRLLRSRTPLGGYGSLLSSNSATSHSNCTNIAFPAPSRDLSLSPCMKPLSEHREVKSMPSESEINESLLTVPIAKPALPKVPTKTTSSTMLQRSARVYRRQKTTQSVGAVPQPRIELKPTPSFETPGLLDLKHSTSAECASFEDDFSLATTLFSVESIDNALSVGYVGAKESSRSSKAIVNLKDVHPIRIRSHVPLKQKCPDDHSVASTVGISHSMSEESTNGTKYVPSQLGFNSKISMKQTNLSGLARAARRRHRSAPKAPSSF